MDGKLTHALDEMIAAEIPLSTALEMFEQGYVAAALRVTNNNRTRAARLLQCHRNTLMRKAGPKFKRPAGIVRVRRNQYEVA